MKILIADEFYQMRRPLLNELLKGYSYSVVSDPEYDFDSMEDRESIMVIGFSSSFFAWRLPNSFLEKFPNVKGLCISGGWHEHVDITYCANRSITVSYIPGFSDTSAAEWCIMASLILARNVVLQSHAAVMNTRILCGTELAGKTAGIVGLGCVGRPLAKKLAGLGMTIRYWSRNRRDPQYMFCDLNELLGTCDFVYITLYDGGDMKEFMNRSRLSRLKGGSYLISGLGSQPGLHGDTVDWDYAFEMVDTGRLSGVALECGEGEVPKHSGGNVFISTGHSGWLTNESFARQTNLWVRNIIDALDGKYHEVLTERTMIPEGHY
jgi:D-3-phosphoglycerate dehydrogenase